MRIALAQLDSAIGDVEANLESIATMVDQANAQDVDLTVFPELATHGYSLGQLLEKRSSASRDERLAALASGRSDVLVGFHEDGGVRAYNSAAYLAVHRRPRASQAVPAQLPDLGGAQALQPRSVTARVRHRPCARRDPDLLRRLAAAGAMAGGAGRRRTAAGADQQLDQPRSRDSSTTRAYWERTLESIGRMQQAWVVFVNRVGSEAGGEFWGGSRVIDPTARSWPRRRSESRR